MSNPSSAGHETQRAIVLIVDDSRVMRIALKKILAEDYTVVEAGNGEQGWSLLEKDPNIACVFTDLAMPELDGFGLLKRIRGSSEERIRSVPVIIITGNEDDRSMRERALSSGANDLVLKPFQSADIKATTKKHMTPKRAAWRARKA